MTTAALDAIEWARRVDGDGPGQNRIVLLVLERRDVAGLQRAIGRRVRLLDVFAVARLLDAGDPTTGPWARRRGASARDHLRGRRVVVVGSTAWRLLDVDLGADVASSCAWYRPVQPGPDAVATVSGAATGPARYAGAFLRALAEAEPLVTRDAEQARRIVVRLAAELGGARLAKLAGVDRRSVVRWIGAAARPGPRARAALARLGVPESAWAKA